MENIGLATVPAEQKPYVGRFIKQAQIRAASAAKPKDDRMIFMLNLQFHDVHLIFPSFGRRYTPPPDVIVSASSPLDKDTVDLPGGRSAVNVLIFKKKKHIVHHSNEHCALGIRSIRNYPFSCSRNSMASFTFENVLHCLQSHSFLSSVSSNPGNPSERRLLIIFLALSIAVG